MQHFKGPRGGDDPLGSAMNSQAHRINIAMTADPQTLQQVSARSGVVNIPRVGQHMRWLVEKGFAERHGSDRWVLNRRGMELLDGHLIDSKEVHRKYDSTIPEEIVNAAELNEGAARTITVNAYERSSKAREICIATYGTSCSVCGFNFGKFYGPDAADYIHVHHLRPLSEIGEQYVVDPVADLRPVCPNCHAVIHLGGETRSIEEVREMIIGIMHELPESP